MMRTDTSKPHGQAQALHSKISNMPLQKGDVVRLVTSCGGGLEHDPEKWAPVFPRDKRGTRLRGDHAQTER
jgi:hypothetical protein